MKTIEKSAAQGDVMFIRVDKLPADVKMVPIADGRAVVAHSETGHHHVAVAEQVRLFGTTNPMICYLSNESEHTDVVHERPYDTHETLRLAPGIWEVRRQRESAPGGDRQVAD
jgi:hypothetical protein